MDELSLRRPDLEHVSPLSDEHMSAHPRRCDSRWTAHTTTATGVEPPGVRLSQNVRAARSTPLQKCR